MRERNITKIRKQIAAAVSAVSVSALFAASAGAALYSVPVMAASASFTGTVTAANIKESGATVKAYQIVKGIYAASGLIKGYETVSGVTIDDIENPTASEVTKIASDIASGNITPASYSMSRSGTSYSASVPAGEYLILVTGAKDTVYNPAIAAVNITDAAACTAENGSADMASYFNIPSKAYLKSSSSAFTKAIIGSSESTDQGDTLKAGDTVTYQLNMTIPSYSAQYKSLRYRITDTLDSTLTGFDDIAVKVGGTEVSASSSTYTVTKEDHKLIIDFADSYVRANAEKPVSIKYKAKLSDSAPNLNASANSNSASLQYSNSPADSSSYKTLTAQNHVYTFGIDAALTGNGKSTHEVLKTDENGKVTEDASVLGGSYTLTGALKGAVFGLYTDEACTKKADTVQANGEAASGNDGRIVFTGLDEGTYYLREITPPSGYTLNDTAYKIDIAASLNTDGSLNSYTVSVTDLSDASAAARVTSYTPDYTSATAASLKDDDISVSTQSSVIKNTPIASMPSTGGRAAVILSIIGAAGMTSVIFSEKKKKKKEEKKS